MEGNNAQKTLICSENQVCLIENKQTEGALLDPLEVAHSHISRSVIST